MKLNQNQTPIRDALERLNTDRVIPFDVPGHKKGMGNKPLREFLGEKCLTSDVNSMKPLDNLCHPVSVIKKAEQLAADAFGAAHAFFMVGGTTSSVQAMIMASCKKGEKIILPRNVHRSVLGALVLNGAIPVYVPVEVNDNLGITLGSSTSSILGTIKEYSDAKAVLINNPSYYGICPDVKKIAEYAHKHNMLLLADEAHGTHFYFGENLPRAAMRGGADMSSVSLHKSGGSLTQSSVLLCGESVSASYVRQIINLTQTTSASYLLLSSLDISRKNLVFDGKRKFAKVLELTAYAREEIEKIGGYYAFSDEIIDGETVYDFDRTKLTINTLGIGLAGIEVYDILRDDYDIQIEFGDFGNILAYISIGDNRKNIEMLIGALAEIKRRFVREGTDLIKQEYVGPIVKISPQEAFYAEKVKVPLDKSEGGICGEFVMCYPPGIPIAAPGEQITPEIIRYINYAKEKGCSLMGMEDMNVEFLNILK